MIFFNTELAGFVYEKFIFQKIFSLVLFISSTQKWEMKAFLLPDNQPQVDLLRQYLRRPSTSPGRSRRWTFLIRRLPSPVSASSSSSLGTAWATRSSGQAADALKLKDVWYEDLGHSNVAAGLKHEPEQEQREWWLVGGDGHFQEGEEGGWG